MAKKNYDGRISVRYPNEKIKTLEELATENGHTNKGHADLSAFIKRLLDNLIEHKKAEADAVARRAKRSNVGSWF
jgi:hypothetical protein